MCTVVSTPLSHVVVIVTAYASVRRSSPALRRSRVGLFCVQSVVSRSYNVVAANVEACIPKTCSASNIWLQEYLYRKALHSVRLHGEAGSVDITKVAKEIAEICRTISNFEEKIIFILDEPGSLFKMFTNRSYIFHTEIRRPVRDTKLIKTKAPVSSHMGTNATGALEITLAFIGHAKSPRCSQKGRPPTTYFRQEITLSNTVTFHECLLCLCSCRATCQQRHRMLPQVQCS